MNCNNYKNVYISKLCFVLNLRNGNHTHKTTKGGGSDIVSSEGGRPRPRDVITSMPK